MEIPLKISFRVGREAIPSSQKGAINKVKARRSGTHIERNVNEFIGVIIDLTRLVIQRPRQHRRKISMLQLTNQRQAGIFSTFYIIRE